MGRRLTWEGAVGKDSVLKVGRQSHRACPAVRLPQDRGDSIGLDGNWGPQEEATTEDG